MNILETGNMYIISNLAHLLGAHGMQVYILATILSLIFAYMSDRTKKSRIILSPTKSLDISFFAVLSFLPLTLIMACRYGVGTDYYSYQRIYLNRETVPEQGFVWMNNILHLITGNPQIFFAFTSVMICASFFIAIYRESVSPLYSILLFVVVKDYFMSMNAIRQYIAIAIILFSIPYIKRKEYIKTAFFIIAAMFFHRSAIIMVPFVVLFILNIRPGIRPGVGVGMIAALSFVAPIIKKFILPILTKFGLYADYFSSINRFSNSEMIFNWQYFLVVSGPFIILCYIYNKISKNDNLRMLYSAVLLSMIIMSLSAYLPTLITRLVWYMDPFIILFLPEAIREIKDKRIRFSANFSTITLYTIVAVRNIMGGAQTVLPYHVFWTV